MIYINKVKYSIEGNLVKPDYFFLVPDFVRKSSNKLRLAYGKYEKIFPSLMELAENLKSEKIDLKDGNEFMEDKTNEKILQDEDVQKLSNKLSKEEGSDNN